MYENNIHSVPDPIVSINQAHTRPIVRGKASALVAFWAKLDLSIDENGMARLESLSFDAYDESDILIGIIKRYKARTAHYPQGSIANKTYRNREKLSFYRQHGIRLSRPALEDRENLRTYLDNLNNGR